MNFHNGTIEYAILDRLARGEESHLDISGSSLHAEAARVLERGGLLSVQEIGEILRVSLTASGQHVASFDPVSPTSDIDG